MAAMKPVVSTNIAGAICMKSTVAVQISDGVFSVEKSWLYDHQEKQKQPYLLNEAFLAKYVL